MHVVHEPAVAASCVPAVPAVPGSAAPAACVATVCVSPPALLPFVSEGGEEGGGRGKGEGGMRY